MVLTRDGEGSAGNTSSPVAVEGMKLRRLRFYPIPTRAPRVTTARVAALGPLHNEEGSGDSTRRAVGYETGDVDENPKVGTQGSKSLGNDEPIATTDRWDVDAVARMSLATRPTEPLGMRRPTLTR